MFVFVSVFVFVMVYGMDWMDWMEGELIDWGQDREEGQYG